MYDQVTWQNTAMVLSYQSERLRVNCCILPWIGRVYGRYSIHLIQQEKENIYSTTSSQLKMDSNYVCVTFFSNIEIICFSLN